MHYLLHRNENEQINSIQIGKMVNMKRDVMLFIGTNREETKKSATNINSINIDK